jgi:hypothetical protein
MLFTNYLKNYYLKDSFDSLEIGIHHGKFFSGTSFKCSITSKDNKISAKSVSQFIFFLKSESVK